MIVAQNELIDEEKARLIQDSAVLGPGQVAAELPVEARSLPALLRAQPGARAPG